MKKRLFFVAVGKCGSRTVSEALRRSNFLSENGYLLKTFHLERPVYNPSAKYLFVVRNPIARAVSAFNWRFRLVVETREKEHQFPGEYEALQRWGTINALAEALFIDGAVNDSARQDWNKICHLRQSLYWYLEPLVLYLRRDQIVAVLPQEYLDTHLQQRLRFSESKRFHSNPDLSGDRKIELSKEGIENISLFLKDDFNSVAWLATAAELQSHERSILLEKSPSLDA